MSLATLDQRGGGVITVEDAKGSVFDSIVFAEKEPQHWVAGSNNFTRSKNAGGPPETAKPDALIHIAAVYRTDGTIALFRNGTLYGEPWKSPTPSPIAFAAGEAHVLLGKRHLSGGKAFLTGEIEEARLYDRALDPADLLASFRAGPNAAAVNPAELAKALTPDERTRRESLTLDLAAARESHRVLSAGAAEKEWRSARADAERDPSNPLHAWASLHRLGGDEMEAAWGKLRDAAHAKFAEPEAGPSSQRR